MMMTTAKSRPCMGKAEKRAWDQGFFSRDEGKSIRANPHNPPKSPAEVRLMKRWREGWKAAAAHPRERPLIVPEPAACLV